MSVTMGREVVDRHGIDHFLQVIQGPNMSLSITAVLLTGFRDDMSFVIMCITLFYRYFWPCGVILVTHLKK